MIYSAFTGLPYHAHVAPTTAPENSQSPQAQVVHPAKAMADFDSAAGVLWVTALAFEQERKLRSC